MAAIAKEDRGAWWVFVTHRGQRTKRRLGPGQAGKAAAQDVVRRVNAQLALDDLSIFERRPTVETVASYAERWLARVAGGRKAGTAESYASVLRTHWVPLIGTLPLDAVKRTTLKDAIAGWLRAGSRSGTVKKQLSILSALFASAVEDGLVGANPVAGLKRHATNTGESPRVIEVFTREEERALFEAATVEDRWVGVILVVLARTGLRIGEALTLKWADLDLVARQLTVNRTWSGARKTRLLNLPKGNRTRTVDVSGQCAAALVKWRDELAVEALIEGREVSPWVFAVGAAALPRWREFDSRWDAVCRTSGVRYRKPHTFRHTFATRLIENGENLAYVQQQLGHASIKITVDLYGHLKAGYNRAAVDKLDDVAV